MERFDLPIYEAIRVLCMAMNRNIVVNEIMDMCEHIIAE
jgi:hypothetical protein